MNRLEHWSPFTSIPTFVLPWVSGMATAAAIGKTGEPLNGTPTQLAALGLAVGFVGMVFIMYREVAE